jgi:hypothetical protein
MSIASGTASRRFDRGNWILIERERAAKLVVLNIVIVTVDTSKQQLTKLMTLETG